MWGGAPPYRIYFIGRASSGRDRNLQSNTDSHSQCFGSLLENRALLENLELLQKSSQPLTSGQALNIEPTLSQISEETLESLKLCERNSRKNFERQTAPSRQPTNEGHPQSDVTQRRTGFPQARKRNNRSASNST